MSSSRMKDLVVCLEAAQRGVSVGRAGIEGRSPHGGLGREGSGESCFFVARHAMSRSLRITVLLAQIAGDRFMFTVWTDLIAVARATTAVFIGIRSLRQN